MKRIDFMKKLATVAVALPFISSLNSCSDDEEAPVEETEDCIANGTNVSIGANHGHTLTVSRFDVDAGVDSTYSILGTSTHNHQVTVTAANFSSLKSNQSISVLSDDSGSGHTHNVLISCA